MVKMRTRNLLLPCAALTSAVSASSDAYLWTVDSGEVKPSSNQVSAISSSLGQQILARRKGLTDSQSVNSASQDVIADLNRFGGWQPPLFGAGEAEPPAKVFISLTGYTGTVSEFNILPDLWIEDAKTTIVDTFEAKFNTKHYCEYHIKPRMRNDASIKYTYFEQSKPCRPQSEIENLPSMLAVTVTLPTASTIGGRGISGFHRTLLHLSTTENLEATLLVLPPISKLKKPTKSELKKRGESPLDLPEISDVGVKDSPVSTTTSNFTLPKIIPQYFTSESSCVNTTNSCMSHGHCAKTHGNLYFCNCTSTLVRTNDDGTNKTVQWGGNACQKKDISTQFILFASIGIFFTALVAGSIGMLFNMGSEQLPSVIGAGVVGPRAQR